MKLTITINMDGAAFEDYPAEEAARILAKAGERLKIHANPLLEAGEIHLYDANGNTCGALVVTEEEGE